MNREWGNAICRPKDMARGSRHDYRTVLGDESLPEGHGPGTGYVTGGLRRGLGSTDEETACPAQIFGCRGGEFCFYA